MYLHYTQARIYMFFYFQGIMCEIQALQNEIAVMSQASQRLATETSADSRAFIQQTIKDLNDRLQNLEEQARLKESTLEEKSNNWSSYQVSDSGQ